MSCEMWTNVSEAPLFQEHLLLGGFFDDEEPLLALPTRYGDDVDERGGLDSAAGLADLSGLSLVLVNGSSAPALIRAACACEPLAVGECAFGAVVTGDGGVAAVPLVARTGETEYLLADPTEQGLSLMPWLGFLAGIEQDGYRPFGDVQIEDVSDALHPLLLWGPKARFVLADYVRQVKDLPHAGRVANVRLDDIMTLALAPNMDAQSCYLLLVPPARARSLWRSFLSFAAVVPVGQHALRDHACAKLAWLEAILRGEAASLGLDELLNHSLVRKSGGYVGERALQQR